MSLRARAMQPAAVGPTTKTLPEDAGRGSPLRCRGVTAAISDDTDAIRALARAAALGGFTRKDVRAVSDSSGARRAMPAWPRQTLEAGSPTRTRLLESHDPDEFRRRKTTFHRDRAARSAHPKKPSWSRGEDPRAGRSNPTVLDSAQEPRHTRTRVI